MSGNQTNPPLVTIGTTQTPFYVGQTASGIKLDYTVPVAGTSPPPTAQASIDTPNVISVTVADPAPAAVGSTPAGVAFTSDVTIVAGGVGTAIVRFLENGMDDGPAAEITVTVSSRPSDTVAVDASGLTISG